MRRRMKPRIWYLGCWSKATYSPVYLAVIRYAQTASVLIGLMVLMLGATLTTETTESTEILVIDLSKKLPENPYQTEYEKMLWPTVRIKTPTSTGSGVFIDNYILTAAHVVGNESIVIIETTNGHESTLINAFVVVTDTTKDLALIKPRISTDIYTAKLASREYKPYLFTPVWAVGCSLGLPPRPSYGHITVIDSSSSVSIRGYEISAPILPGNSGGPVYDAKTFEVIGIAVWVHTYKNQIVTTMAGIVPIQSIYEFLDKARAAGLYAQQTWPLEHSSEFIMSRCSYAHRGLRAGNALARLAGQLLTGSKKRG